MKISKEEGCKTLHLAINRKKYEWTRQYITGAEIRQLAGIPQEEEVYLAIKEPWDDELISDDFEVNLARPGIEHFFSMRAEKEVVLIVNGTPKEWHKKRIRFEDVVTLAFGDYVDSQTMVYTVVYEDGPCQNPEGSMVKGTVVFVKHKMIFHATATDKS